MQKLYRAGAVLVALAILFATLPALAGEVAYPTRQVTYMVTWDPGGQSDIEARRQQPCSCQDRLHVDRRRLEVQAARRASHSRAFQGYVSRSLCHL